MLQSPRNLSNRFDLVLAWLAIFLWGTAWTQGYTGINGVANLTHRALTWDWGNIYLINTKDAFMCIVSILYWIFFIGILFFIGLMIW